MYKSSLLVTHLLHAIFEVDTVTCQLYDEATDTRALYRGCGRGPCDTNRVRIHFMHVGTIDRLRHVDFGDKLKSEGGWHTMRV